MIKNPNDTLVFSFRYTHTTNPNVVSVQVFSERQAVTVAYVNEAGCVVEADYFSKAEHPELQGIVVSEPYDDVWDLPMILSLIEPLDAEEPACDSAPEWKFVQWQPTDKPAFINPPEVYAQAAS